MNRHCRRPRHQHHRRTNNKSPPTRPSDK
jgi:hypothetical protein